MQQSGVGRNSASIEAFGHTRWSLVAVLRDQDAAPGRNPLEKRPDKSAPTKGHDLSRQTGPMRWHARAARREDQC